GPPPEVASRGFKENLLKIEIAFIFMKIQNFGSNIIDGRSSFQEGQIDALHEKIYNYETYSKDELSQTIATVNSINVKTLTAAALEKFQNLCGRLHKSIRQ
ncbi:MAG: hypothetical protein AAGE99_02255, partial [Chlamydiota bacterium]